MSNGFQGNGVEQGRILGIDYGTSRIGLALSDPLRILASAYATLEQSPVIWDELRVIIEKENVEFAVVGSPLNLKGEKGQKALEVDRFADSIRDILDLEVVRWDERFTTTLANRYRMASGMGKKSRRESRDRVDAVAAAIMLQGFLDSTKKSLSC